MNPHSSYRWYSDVQVVAARLVARLLRVGMPLADIRRVIEHRDEPATVDAAQESAMNVARTTTSALRAVQFAVGTDPGLPMLTGVLLDDASTEGSPASVLLPVAIVEEVATVLTLADIEIGVNREFLLAALDVEGAGQLLLELDGPPAPLTIRHPRRPDGVHMLMPIRLA